MAVWTTETQPFGPNHAPLLTALSSSDGKTPVPLAADSATGALIVETTGGGGGGTQYTDGSSVPTHPIGGASELNIGGTWYTETGTNVNGSTPSANVFVMNATGGSPLGRVTLTDNNNANQANITASTTAAATTDEGLVVSLSPNSPIPTGTNTIGSVKLTNGTNTADVVANDTGYNGVVINQGAKVIAFSTSTTGVQTLLANTDVRGYSTITIQFTSVGTGAAINGQFCATSGGTYGNMSNASWYSPTSIGNGLNISVNAVSVTSVSGPFFQLGVTALTGGTLSGNIILSSRPPGSMPVNQLGTWTVGSNSATGSAIPANAFAVGGSDGTNLQMMRFSKTDASTDTGMPDVIPFVYNGTNQDRTRSATAASNTTGTGLLGVGNLGYDGTNYQLMGVAAANATTTGVSGISTLTSGTGFTTATLTLNSGTPSTNWYDMLNYAWVSVEILTNTTPATLTWQTSGDSAQTNITSSLLAPASTSAGTYSTSTVSATGTFHGPRTGRWFRVNSNNGAGSTTLVITFHTVASASTMVPLTIGSSSATASAVPANAFYTGINNGGGNLVGIMAAGGTGDNSTGSTGVLDALTRAYNGTNTDRIRNNTTGAVIAAGATSGSSVTTTTYNARSMAIIINVSAYTSGTITVAINGITSSNYSYPLISSITGLAATGVSIYRIGPGLTPSAGLVANDLLPRSVQVVIGGTFSATFGVDYELSV